MSQQPHPFPVGTRVVLTWSINPKFIGGTGSALSMVVEPGTPARRDDNLQPMVTVERSQAVRWDDGDMTVAPIAWLRPIQDPDAEPITETVAEDMTA